MQGLSVLDITPQKFLYNILPFHSFGKMFFLAARILFFSCSLQLHQIGKSIEENGHV